jgi:hypothetical protein
MSTIFGQDSLSMRRTLKDCNLKLSVFFQLYVPFVWDAVMTFAYALSSLIKAGKNYSGLDLLQQVKITSFEGLTGE